MSRHKEQALCSNSESMLKIIAGKLEGCGYKVLYGSKDGKLKTVFYNKAPDEPVHSLAFKEYDPSQGGCVELIGGFIAYGLDEDYNSAESRGIVEHLYGGELAFYKSEEDLIAHPRYLEFASAHYENDCLINKFVPGGYSNPLVRKGMMEEHDYLS